jgi:hypothetical protein
MVAGEALLIGLALGFGQSPYDRAAGLVLLGHLAWTTLGLLQSHRLDFGTRSRGVRSNHELRTHVVDFLREVKRVEAFRRRAVAARLSREQVDERVVAGQLQILTSASKVVKVVGRQTDAPSDPSVFRNRSGRSRAALVG